MTEIEQAIESIRVASIAKWGEDFWLRELVKSYNKIYAPMEPPNKAFTARWSQFRRIMKEAQPPTGETLLRLARAAKMKRIKL